MKTFETNQFNVCVDCNKYEFYKGNDGEVYLETAFLGGKWRGGNKAMFGSFGCGGLPSVHDKPFESERECIENEAIWMENYLKNNGLTKDFGKIFKLKIEELFPREKQLTLF